MITFTGSRYLTLRINMAKCGKCVQTPKQERFQKALVKMMIIYELPFSCVEEDVFKELILEATFPSFRMPPLDMIGRDCAQLFLDEKLKLKRFIKRTNQRVCLAVDTWTSNQSVNYLCITAHFIDNNWKLHKKIISFSPVSSNDGEEMGKAVEKCLHDWEINNVMTISIAGDASSVNEVAISYLRGRLVNNVLDGKFLYLRCIVDFTKTMVKDCLNRYDESITRVRAAVRYVLQSPYRIEKFKRYAREWTLYKRECCLFLDCPTNWVSTLGMLKMCEDFDQAFYVFEDNDPTYKHCLEDTCGVPCREDWDNIRQVVYFLEGFYRSTKDISELYVSSNEFLDKLVDVHFHLPNCGKQVDTETMMWASDMLWKFYEYWGDVAKDPNMSYCVSNPSIYIANILDPRSRTDLMEHYFMNIDKHEYTDDGEKLWKKKAEVVIAAIYELFNEYVCTSGAPQQKANFQSSGYKQYLYEDTSHLGLFDKHEVGFGGNVDCKTEIDIYLNEDTVQDFAGFKLLLWWKYIGRVRYPILSKMAKDVLAIPASVTPPESAYSTSGNLLDDFRSSLSPSTVEALVCTQDWIRKSSKKTKVVKGSIDLDKFVKGMCKHMKGTTI